MHVELVLLLASFSICIFTLFVFRKGIARRFLENYSSKVDERFNSVEVLQVQARQMFDQLNDELKKVKTDRERALDSLSVEMEAHLSSRIADANKVGEAKMALIKNTLEQERERGFEMAEARVKKVVVEGVFEALSSSGVSVADDDQIRSVLAEAKKRVH